MKPVDNRAWRSLVGLLLCASVAGAPEHGAEAARGRPTGGERQAATDDDYQVIEAVLLDLIKSKDFTTFVDDGQRTDVVLDEKTAGGSRGNVQLDHESNDQKWKVIGAEIRADLGRRNTNEPVSLRGFRPTSERILVRDISGIRRMESVLARTREFGRQFPGARVYVGAWLPGYSRDGQTAVLRARFDPTAHGGQATYIVTKNAGRWAVVWREFRYYG
jgi:hypothetical protein